MAGSPPPTPLYLPYTFPFPSTVQRLHKPVGSRVNRLDKLFDYACFVPVEGGQAGEVERVVRSWECPIEGDIVRWDVHEGDKITNAK